MTRSFDLDIKARLRRVVSIWLSRISAKRFRWGDEQSNADPLSARVFVGVRFAYPNLLRLPIRKRSRGYMNKSLIGTARHFRHALLLNSALAFLCFLFASPVAFAVCLKPIWRSNLFQQDVGPIVVVPTEFRENAIATLDAVTQDVVAQLLGTTCRTSSDTANFRIEDTGPVTSFSANTICDPSFESANAFGILCSRSLTFFSSGQLCQFTPDPSLPILFAVSVGAEHLTERVDCPVDLQKEKDDGPPNECAGNPCNPANGNKYQSEVDYPGTDGIASLVRSYNSQSSNDFGLGFGWSSAPSKSLDITNNAGNRTVIVQIHQSNGRGESFICANSVCKGDVDTRITLTPDASGYTLKRMDGSSERYNTNGVLLSETDPSGLVTTYISNGFGRPISVVGPYGHTFSFTYDKTHVASFTDPAGGVHTYAYDINSNLIQVTYPDGGAKRYHYENTSFPHHLTGISYIEGNGTTTRYGTYAYDVNGKAISTEHAGGIERYSLSYDSDTQTTVTDAAGTQEVMTFSTKLGVKNLVAKTNQGDGKTVEQVFDNQNNLTCRKDEEDRIKMYASNSANQVTFMVEGFQGTCSSPSPTGALRSTNYQYVSSTLSAPTVIEIPSVADDVSQKITMTYGDARFPTLPTQITRSGFTPDGVSISRAMTFSYDSFGRVTAVDGARTDVNDVTTFSHFACTSGGACGRLQSVTNALGHVTTFDTYDGAGRLLQSTAPNGLRTSYTYDGRGRVITVAQASTGASSRLTQYSYNAAGNITRVVFPDGITLIYTYDAAQKLRQVTDNQGNQIVYSYDLKGNRVQEVTYDPNNILVRQIDTAYDIRNHVASINAAGSLTQQIYDAVGNLVQQADPNQVAAGSDVATTHDYDALNRLAQTVNNLGNITAYAYDKRDRVVQVIAPNDATTQYIYDDLGNRLQEISLDRGAINYTYDTAGNVTSVTDARGVTANYIYDALNRVVNVTYPASPSENIAFAYDSASAGVGTCAFGIGRLCSVQDESGITQYAYDAFGNLVQQVKTELGINYLTSYTYDAGNRVSSVRYPDGRVVNYGRDSLGRIQAIAATINGTNQIILSGRTYRPDGLPLTQTYGNGLSETRSYDLRGKLIDQFIGTADTRVYSYDANGNLTQKQTLPEGGNYVYDALDRLTDEATSDNNHNAFTYDQNGNRVSDLRANGTTRPYTYTANTNRLQTLGTQTITLDANGNTTIDRNGNRLFSYNNANHLTQVTINGVLKGTYTYNYLNQRTRKIRTTTNATTGVTTTTTFIYHYDINGNLIAETRPNGKLIRAYLYSDNEPIAQIQTKGTSPEELSYLHVDHLGTPRLATNSAQTVVWRFASEAFGTGKPDTDPDADGVNVQVRLRMAGQYADGESGLYYNWNRYYDPRTGRYITSDPIGLDGGLNTFTYVRNNPLRYTDPSGLFDPSTWVVPIVETVIEGSAAAGSAILVGVGALLYPSPAGDPNGGDMLDPDTGSRRIPDPDKPKCGCTCICRADANDNIPGNIKPGDKTFAFGEASAQNCSEASKLAKRAATRALGKQPKHVGCKCSGK
jgi:RHS repeat-associated protein